MEELKLLIQNIVYVVTIIMFICIIIGVPIAILELFVDIHADTVNNRRRYDFEHDNYKFSDEAQARIEVYSVVGVIILFSLIIVWAFS